MQTISTLCKIIVMSKTIENTPKPNILMNSMRSIGYSFKTALADIVDNSISAMAKRINIFFPMDGNKLFISILDDGVGMDDEELFMAMKYGTPRKPYQKYELGRFGVGLKTASFSQCKILIVASKKDGFINCYKWDLDEVEKTEQWCCQKLDDNEIKNIPNIECLEAQESGTLVIWRKFDIAHSKSDGHVFEYLSEQLEEASTHLRLVFSRFLDKNLEILVNGCALESIDPFLEKNPKTDAKSPTTFKVIKDDPTTEITVQSFILPHQNDLSNDDIEKLGGMEAIRNGQGFYVYRNDRLIIYGTWFNMSTSTLNNELYKYGRIKVDIPNSLDSMWEIDIKKQNVVIPKRILNLLKRKVSDVRRASTKKIERRTKLTYDENPNKIWNKGLSRDQKDYYYVNINSKFISYFLSQFNDADKNKIIRLIDIISTAMPYDDIYNSVCNKKNETKLSEEQFDNIVVNGCSIVKQIMSLKQCSAINAINDLEKNEPFNKIEIIAKIKERFEIND